MTNGKSGFCSTPTGVPPTEIRSAELKWNSRSIYLERLILTAKYKSKIYDTMSKNTKYRESFPENSYGLNFKNATLLDHEKIQYFQKHESSILDCSENMKVLRMDFGRYL
jgi:hypothetical protein